MNISKLVAAAMKVMPKTVTKNQMIGVALFAGGLLAGSLFRCGGEEEKKIGDNFEKQEKVEQKADSTEVKALPKEPVDTVPVITADNYDKVQVGKGAIESADTAYYIETGKIARISFYMDKDKKRLIHKALFDENGKLERYVSVHPDKKNAKCEYTDYTAYNVKGEIIENSYASEENGWQYVEFPQNWDKEFQTYEQQYDKNGNLRISKQNCRKYNPELESSGCEAKKTYFELDGSRREENYCKGDNYIEYFDKNDRLLKKKVLGYNDVLKYTVVPKYDKEGTLIKNDTIKNEQ